MNADELLQRIRGDNRSGATQLTHLAAQFLKAELESGFFADSNDFRKRLLASGKALISAQPAMASIFNLVNNLLIKIQEGEEVAALNISDFLETLERHAAETAQRGASLIQDGCTIATHSLSSVVSAAITAAHQEGKRVLVLCSESRPVCEGRGLAQRLVEEGVQVRLVVDSALPSILDRAQMVMVGADAITGDGVINKVGTYGLALAANQVGIPFFVLSPTEKVLPAQVSAIFKEEPKAPEEVWDFSHPNLEVLNLYFDITPVRYITALVCEKGKLRAEAISSLAHSMPVMPELLE